MEAPCYIIHRVVLARVCYLPPHPSPPSVTRALYIRLPLGMEFTVRFLLFLRKITSFFHKRWDQSARMLWYIFAFVRSRILSQRPKKRDQIRRNIEHRPDKPPTTVICASQFPHALSPIAGGDTPIASPIPIQVRHPTIPSQPDAVHETHENRSNEHLDVDNYLLKESRPISRSPDSASHREPEHIHAVLSSPREDGVYNPPVIPSRPPSGYSHRPTSQYQGSRPQSQYSGHRPPSQYSHPPPSHHSYRSPEYLSGAEAAARGYHNTRLPSTRSPSPAVTTRPPSITPSVASHVYRASRPTSRVQRPLPMRNASRQRARSSTPASTRQSMYGAPPDLPRPESRTSGSIHRDLPSTSVSPGPASPVPPKDRLRPMMAIARYDKHRAVVVQDTVTPHTFLPVTIQFML